MEISQIKKLKSKGLPFPLKRCDCCGKTMFKKGHWIQCPDCGNISDRFGGTFPNISPAKGECSGASDDWVKECRKAREFLN